MLFTVLVNSKNRNNKKCCSGKFICLAPFQIFRISIVTSMSGTVPHAMFNPTCDVDISVLLKHMRKEMEEGRTTGEVLQRLGMFTSPSLIIIMQGLLRGKGWYMYIVLPHF